MQGAAHLSVAVLLATWILQVGIRTDFDYVNLTGAWPTSVLTALRHHPNSFKNKIDSLTNTIFIGYAQGRLERF